MFCIYVGFSCVIYSIFTIEHPRGAQYTPPISVTMQCVINLTVQFFFIYLWIWVAITIKEFTGYEWVLMMQTMENAKGTVMYCPMLAILFVGTRMRALLITNNKGAPQGWAQDGTSKWEPTMDMLKYVALALKWITFIFLYGGTIAVIVALYTMTPETANGRGSVPLVGDGKIPGVGVSVPGYSGLPEPVGANDLIPAGGDGYNLGPKPGAPAPAAADPA